VARLMGQGRSTKEIAAELNVSIKTVETHQRNLKHKLGLRTNTELLRWCVVNLLEQQQQV
jgi:DNA-binding CsgD family transcriptional regulator